MQDSIQTILESCKTLAIVGLSSRPTRPSNGVSSYMKSHGYRIIPVNPNEESVLGEKCYATLDEVPESIDAVVIFRRSEFVPEIVERAIHKGAKVIWMQEGIQNEQAAQRAIEAGLTVVQNRCILKEHAKHFVCEGI